MELAGKSACFSTVSLLNNDSRWRQEFTNARKIPSRSRTASTEFPGHLLSGMNLFEVSLLTAQLVGVSF